ncbi:MAG: serine hydrolase, partial [Phycisphaerae bacterium]|nr:serine hydrolase [Phycisphaerae bacterium]
NNHIQMMRRAGRVTPDEKTSWSIYDFTARKKLVAIREDVPHQGASMIKPFIAQAYFFRHQENRRRYP